ncbi:hypothetical protein V22_20680 [Calycomorphotria hydatis]|uniref:4-hydroxy-tetrahydrodipicolinate synthase n=2 Tax=Calycomorphotria hydatis TaxID=2528027 RepID=A0A517T8W8_9PLAN|nr:hypothetical protein V22_20680 [Calycomorphotria hydatis]
MITPVPVIPRRKITGMSAVLLPFTDNHEVDWNGFRTLLTNTVSAGLIPAVNMDTGYANLIDEPTRLRVLDETKSLLAGKEFIAGAYVGDLPEAAFNRDAYTAQIDQITTQGGTPIIFQSFGLTSQSPEEIVAAYSYFGTLTDSFYAFELGQMFAPFGQIYELDLYRQLMEIPACKGAKHSSLSRRLEWERLQLRNEVRPDFLVLTGNDLAIDMVMYGSDYLLGLSAFAPDLFARRDALWENGHSDFYEINDLLQYLGFFAFRQPVPAYKHTAAQFLKLRGWLNSDATHPDAVSRPATDIAILEDIKDRVEAFLS